MNTPSHAPHAHGGSSTGAIIARVMVALTPLTRFGF